MKQIFDFILKLLGLFKKTEQTPIEAENTSETTNETAEGTESETDADAPDEGEGAVVESGETEETEPDQVNWKYIVLLDNGHAKSTPGKRSPEDPTIPRFYEYEFNRDIVKRIAKKLDKLGVPYEVLVPEVEEDIPLSTRAERANAFCQRYGAHRCLFISVHANAAGNGSQWMDAKGWCCYTSKGETASDPFAEIFMREAEDVLGQNGWTIRKYSQTKYSWEDNFTVLVKTKCPAILTENMFYDNKREVKFLQLDRGRDLIAQLHVNAILKIENLR